MRREDAMHTPRRPNKPRRVIYSIDELPAYCDCCDVGLYLRVNPEAVARMAREGVLRGAKIGQSWRFRKEDILDYERRLFGMGGDGEPENG